MEKKTELALQEHAARGLGNTQLLLQHFQQDIEALAKAEGVFLKEESLRSSRDNQMLRIKAEESRQLAVDAMQARAAAVTRNVKQVVKQQRRYKKSEISAPFSRCFTFRQATGRPS